MADVLDTGPPPVRPVRTRRWATTAGAVVLAGVAALLAARSDPDPGPAPAPAVPAPPVAGPDEPALVSLAVGPGGTYAVAGGCDTGTPACRYTVHRRDPGDGRWQRLPWEIGPQPWVGLAPAVSVTGGGVTVVTSNGARQVFSSADEGRTVTARSLTAGPPVAAAAGILLAPGYCAGCEDRITVLEPATGRARPLAVQPPLGGARLRSVDRAGDVLWVAAVGPGNTTTAVSTDAGRSWRAVPAPGGTSPNQLLRVVAGADGSAWLVAGSYRAGPPGQLTQVRRIDGPGGSWRTLPGPAPRTVRSALGGDRGLLLVEVTGAVWRLSPEGRSRRLADPGLLRPGELARGPDGEVASLSPDDANGRTVLLSYDEGETWTAERVP